MPLQEWVAGTLLGRSSDWVRYLGSGVITVLSVLIVAVLWRKMGAIADPGLLLLFTVAASTYLAGGTAGMLSAAIVLFCSFVIFSHPLYPFRYSELEWRQMMVIVVACPVIALMVGSLKEQVERLKLVTREAEALREEIRRFEPIREAQYLCEQRYQLMTDCITDFAVCQLDGSGAVRGWNTGAERLLGYSAAEIVGQSYSRFFTKEDILARYPERLMDQARFSGRAGQEAWRIRKGGVRLHCRSSIISLRNQEGADAGYLLIIHDLTPLEEANLAALKAQAELEAIRIRLGSTSGGSDTPA
ncbi:MAG: PAS domain-containing protein [Gammaproteobacteria bacterium]